MLLDYENRIYLSKRNLLTLLSKLERLEAGEDTKCAIIKHANALDPYCNTIDEVAVIAIPDEKFYVNRQPGPMHPKEEAKLKNDSN
mgnify:CR=1 FL=1